MPTSSIVRNIEQQLAEMRKAEPPENGMQITKRFASGLCNQIQIIIPN